MNQINAIQTELIELREKLRNHPLYSNLKTLEDLQIFMQNHVFAVWDFMSLLKSLQASLTCTKVPWIPPRNPVLSRFINEIVWGEESDVNEKGEPKSHFEMYREAMLEIGADVSIITDFVFDIKEVNAVSLSIERLKCIPEVKEFLNYTFEVIRSKKDHKIASAFTFGREDLIPDMFYEILSKSETDEKKFDKLKYYLDRHIEVDSGDHGPLSLKMIEELCDNDAKKWLEVKEVAKKSLEKRILLWDGILEEIQRNKI
ncbi:DUF3050 domain-containing protein [Lacihabitans soyangensis]|uniref:DUF3050 domain-containing protein n=1 Tax=Lacihabitans soyangensis TaxID=869394 RepID=A0AAE3KT53_9BACT|nr:DUF3050 domain-containing protein [Lacihabitans soyangensis]MCP9763344.1 DUF3050 domain-containing protein [Lacihabitans soyangensis]